MAGSATQFAVTSPNDGQTIETLPLASGGQVMGALEKAVALTEDPAQAVPVEERISILETVARQLEAEAEDFAMRIATEGGKPLKDARVETSRAIEGIRLAVRELLPVMTGEAIPMNMNKASQDRTAFTLPEPVGVVAAISAFNHPLNLIVHQVIPAVAVGTPVIVKPDLRTPLSCLALCDLLTQAGLPEGWVTPLLCSNELAEQLVTDARISFFNFIGSAKVGWSLRSKLAAGTHCALEHGGAAPVIVLEDADMEMMIPKLLKGGYYHAGQVCVSVQRVFAPKKMARQLAERLAEDAKQLVVGDARHEETDVGPMIAPREADRVMEWVEAAVEDGAERIGSGTRINERYIAPIVLLDPPEDAKISKEEVFGPVICVYGYESLDDAIAQANDVEYAFQAAVFGRDVDQMMEIAKRLVGGAVMLNDHTAFRVDWMPFGGYRRSGLGKGGIGYTMRDYTRQKLLVLHHPDN